MSSMLKAKTLPAIVDDLGRLKARISKLQAIEDQLAARLRESGETEVDGSLFRATISTYESTKVAWKAVVESLPKSASLTRKINANTSVSETTSVRVVARKTGG